MAQSREVSESIDTSALLREHLTRSTGWKSPHAVPTLVQTLQIEDDLVRLKLVQVLASVSGPEASRALVERALFDLSPDVRDEAIAALRARPLTEFQERLLQGFRYPWPEAARHAAEVSVELNALELIEPLTALPALPDPSRPQHDAHGHWTTTELVRINHLGNCTLCHARANKPDQGFVVSVPISGRPLQPLYYDMSPGEDAIQADVVFLYQDFSLIHVTTAFQPWPSEQRYDYLVQTRRLTEREIADAKLGGESATEHSETTSYPQRDAVLLTLARLKDRRP